LALANLRLEGAPRTWEWRLYGREKHVALDRPAVLLIVGVVIGVHGQALLLHVGINACGGNALDLISVALGRICGERTNSPLRQRDKPDDRP
jgi:hypothetical protein